MGKKCFFCGSNSVIKKGLKQGKQRWRCKRCGRVFAPNTRVKSSAIENLYSQGNLTVRQIASALNISERTVFRHLAKIEFHVEQRLPPGKIIAMMDTTYWGRDFGVVAIKDHISGRVLWSKFICRKERVDDYVEGVSVLEGEGFEIAGIVSDGLRGLRKRLSRYPFQYCQFHQLQTVIHKLTNRPRLPASKELLEIAKLLCKTDKESFVGVLSEWHARWESFIGERTKDENGKSRYIHKNLRSAFLSLKRNIPWLWTFYDNIELGIPNTNNEMESLFSSVKNKLDIHSGFIPRAKEKAHCATFFCPQAAPMKGFSPIQVPKCHIERNHLFFRYLFVI